MAGDGDDNTGVGVGSYPHPIRPSAPRALSLFFAAGAAGAGFLGYCKIAGILALLSLVFNLWDLFQPPGRSVSTSYPSGGGRPGTGGSGSGNPNRPDRPTSA